MFKKTSLFVIICLIILSISSVKGISINLKKREIYQSTVESDIIDIIEDINEDLLYNYLEKFVSFGYKKVGSEEAHQAALWIKSEFKELGLETYFDEWKYPKYQDKNVVAVHPGINQNSDAVFLVIAHYDTIGNSPGANDDGTGVAAMLAIAKVTQKYSFNHTIRFVAVSGEEVGTYGSFYDAKKAYQNNENIVAVLSIDSIGVDKISEKGDLVQLFTKDRSKWIFEYTKEIAQKYNQCFNIIPQFGANYPADHECYNDYGYDSVMFVQPAPELSNLDPFHTPEDTIDKIDFPYFTNVTKSICAVTCELLNKPIDVQVRFITPYEGHLYVGRIPIKLPCFNLCFTRIRALTYIFGSTTAKINITTNENVSSVYFGIDGYARHILNEPPYEYKIGEGFYSYFRLKRHHRLTVVVTTDTGKTACDEMDIFILKAFQ